MLSDGEVGTGLNAYESLNAYEMHMLMSEIDM